jgi:hypothetical protein
MNVARPPIRLLDQDKHLHREEFFVGWTAPEGARSWLGPLLLAQRAMSQTIRAD